MLPLIDFADTGELAPLPDRPKARELSDAVSGGLNSTVDSTFAVGLFGMADTLAKAPSLLRPEVTEFVAGTDYVEHSFPGARLIKGRLRAVLDDASLHTKPGAMEIQVLERLKKSAGESHIVSGKFKRFAHNKVFIRKVDGKPHSVLTGSANFSLRGLYVQANSVLRFDDADVAAKHEEAFETAFTNMKGFAHTPISQQWFDFEKPGLPRFGVAFSPHVSGNLSLDRVSQAIAKAKSSVIYAVMELDGSGKVLEELRGLPKKDKLDHYEFRDSVQGAPKEVPLILQGATPAKGMKPWWHRFYDPDDISYVERTLFVR